MDNKNESALSDDALWDKCDQDTPITSQDLGISKLSPSDGTTLLTEGTNIHQYSLKKGGKSEA